MLSKFKHIVALLLALILTFGTLLSAIAGEISTSEPT
ncbi:hypothetical protein Sgly_0284 [Syntrophobotulus glycolicus DSM 8271]|uniref:Uncharacterized protein n=1 Tax=Syntrophobotulus glycolicus (strain DSM 8271 / FlGlyR) TaxID=645991 RepID=F0SWW3_SYNGF|nr:hypothetical protein Sgly_0284 [Syntrophobotulus glycolicus DSM 8271]